MAEIHSEIKKQEETMLEQKLKKMENNKNNMSKCFEAMREIKAMKPKKPLIIKDPDSQNIIGNKSEQTKLITNHFKNQFYKQAPPIPNIQPKPMSKPFTSEEI